MQSHRGREVVEGTLPQKIQGGRCQPKYSYGAVHLLNRSTELYQVCSVDIGFCWTAFLASIF